MAKDRSTDKQADEIPVKTPTERPPSQETDAFWIDAPRMQASRRGRTRHKESTGGKWMIFVPRARIDELQHARSCRPNPDSRSWLMAGHGCAISHLLLIESCYRP